MHERPYAFAGRQWDLRVSARPQDVPEALDRSAWLFAAAGLLSAAMLGASLLITTGRTRRIESAVRERTADLRAEVGERHVAEAALRASEQRFRNILDNVPIGVIYSDLNGRVIQANPRFCELTGYSEAELAALPPTELTHPEDRRRRRGADRAAGARRDPDAPPPASATSPATGEVVWVRATVTLLRDSDSQPRRIVGVVEDITEHLRLEEAERAREAAEAANRAKSEFLSRMSHELRTPLNAMLGFAQLLEIDQRHPLAAAQRPWVGQIQQAGWHLLEMINDVLDLSRIESGNLRLQPATLDLPELVGGDGRPGRQRRRAAAASGSARTSARARRRIVGDATRVKQILTNLLSNAVKYNADGGRVHIASRLVRPDCVEIAVTDTGMGMTPAQLDELFQPFNRLGRERTATAGHRHRPGDQPAPGRADGRLDRRPQRPRRGLVVHPAPAAARSIRTRCRSDLDALESEPRRLPPADRPLRRGQRNQRRGDARHPGAARPGADGGLGDRPRRPGGDPRRAGRT